MGKQRINLTCDAALLAEAKAGDINLSEAFEQSLRTELARRRAAQWRAENEAAIQAYNKRVEKNGTFVERLRGW